MTNVRLSKRIRVTALDMFSGRCLSSEALLEIADEVEMIENERDDAKRFLDHLIIMDVNRSCADSQKK